MIKINKNDIVPCTQRGAVLSISFCIITLIPPLSAISLSIFSRNLACDNQNNIHVPDRTLLRQADLSHTYDVSAAWGSAQTDLRMTSKYREDFA